VTALVGAIDKRHNGSYQTVWWSVFMATATIAPSTTDTVADLLDSLGGIPPQRVRMRPHPGTATEDDVLAIYASEKRLCELVDGTLVEKAMGFDESRFALEIGRLILNLLDQYDLGTAAGADGMMRLLPGLVRIPDVSFIRWERLPKQYGAIVPIAPDLAVEVLSESDTPKEMERKLHDYFSAGAQLVWIFDLKARKVTVYTSPAQFTVLDSAQTLDGGAVLPGLQIALGALFDRASRRSP
jgi:Uma2 family endonuclease